MRVRGEGCLLGRDKRGIFGGGGGGKREGGRLGDRWMSGSGEMTEEKGC